MKLDKKNDDFINTTYSSVVDFVRVLFRWKKMIAIFFTTVVLVTLLVTLSSPDIYQSEATILIKAGRENTLLSPTTTIGQTTTVRRDYINEINSEIQILKSRDLATKTVTNLGVEAFKVDTNDFGQTVSKINGVIKKSMNRVVAGVKGVFLSDDPDLYTEIVSTEEIKKDEVVKKIMKKFTCEAINESNVIVLRYESNTPEMASAVLSEWISNYLEKHMSVHRTKGSYEFFKNQTETLGTNLEKTAKDLKSIKNITGISSLEKQRTILIERIESLQNYLNTVNTELAGKTKKVMLLDENLDDVPKTIIREERKGSASSAVEELRKQIYILNLEEQELLSKFSEESVPITEIRRRLKSAEELLVNAEVYQEVTSGINDMYKQIEMDIMFERAEIVSLQETAKKIDAQLKAAKKELKILNDYEIEITSLEREFEIEEANYKKYVEGKEQARIDSELESGKLSNISIAQECTVPIEPIKPRRGMYLGFGVFVGIFGSVGLALFREYLSHTFVSPEDVEKLLGIPILGTLPVIESWQKSKNGLPIRGQFYLTNDTIENISKEKENDGKMLLDDSDSGNVSEDVLMSTGGGQTGCKVISVTGSRDGEGVSTFSVYFASMIRNILDKKVLLVDTNFEKPEIHKILGGELSPGLWDIMIKNKYVKAFQKDDAHRFEYISAGKISHVNIGTQGHNRIKKVLNEIKKGYDYIVLDTSPMWDGSGGKATEIESLADGVILVVEAEKIRWEVAMQSKMRLEKIHANIMGAILNKRRFHIPSWLYNKF